MSKARMSCDRHDPFPWDIAGCHYMKLAVRDVAILSRRRHGMAPVTANRDPPGRRDGFPLNDKVACGGYLRQGRSGQVEAVARLADVLIVLVIMAVRVVTPEGVVDIMGTGRPGEGGKEFADFRLRREATLTGFR
jgi:hypothetical protein